MRATLPDNDWLFRFELERAAVRGVFVRLSDSWQQVLARSTYPDPIARLLGQALAASALFTGNIKFEGTLSIQLKNAGPLHLLFAECDNQGRLRGLARWTGEIAADFRLAGHHPTALLAMTIDNRASGRRYQGMVEVEDARMDAMFARYFERSEQLPTRLLLACDRSRCAGMMLQRLPGDAGRAADGDAWNRVGHLLATASDAELLETEGERLLLRLFHEEGVRMHGTHALQFGCSCSRTRVASMLQSLGRGEAEAALREDGMAEVICEFCNTAYRFDRVDLEQLFHAGAPPAPATRQ